MKKLIFTLCTFAFVSGFSQTAKDLFGASDVEVTYLGIDYSHVKLVGEFAQIGGAGDKGLGEIKNTYFPSWNNVVLSEPEKYDLAGMLRKEHVTYDPEMIMKKNDETPIEELEAYQAPFYKKEDIQKFVNEYNTEGKKGIGILFLAECLNKNKEEAYFHFVAFNMETKEVLVQERLMGEPGGFGLRNYWVRPIYNIIRDIEKKQYKIWKSKY